jgi:integrase
MGQARWQAKHENRFTSFDGRLYLERRPRLSPHWYGRCCHQGKQLYRTTKSPLLADAQTSAEKWYLDILRRIDAGEPVSERTLRTTFQAFISYHERDLLKTGGSNAGKIRDYLSLWNGIEPALGDCRLSEITGQRLEEFRKWRHEQSKRTLTEKTLRNYLGLIRLVLRYAARNDWLTHVPEFPQVKIKHDHPDWLTPEEFHTLTVTSENRIVQASECGNAASHVRAERVELHAFVYLMGHGCIRVNECLNLEWRDLQPHPDNERVPPFKRQILIQIRGGKTGPRQAIGTFGVEIAMNHLRELHPNAKPTDKLFTTPHRHGMAKLLEAAELRRDSKGRLRNAKTLRHTSIMLRFLYEPDIRPHELEIISGTSAAVLEEYYLKHLTGTSVSNRLMKKALEEYTKAKEAPLVWGTQSGKLKTSTRKRKR